MIKKGGPCFFKKTVFVEKKVRLHSKVDRRKKEAVKWGLIQPGIRQPYGRFAVIRDN